MTVYQFTCFSVTFYTMTCLRKGTWIAELFMLILQALPKMQNLEVINFGDCLIRTDGAVEIANAIKSAHQKLRVSFSHRPL